MQCGDDCVQWERVANDREFEVRLRSEKEENIWEFLS